MFWFLFCPPPHPPTPPVVLLSQFLPAWSCGVKRRATYCRTLWLFKHSGTPPGAAVLTPPLFEYARQLPEWHPCRDGFFRPANDNERRFAPPGALVIKKNNTTHKRLRNRKQPSVLLQGESCFFLSRCIALFFFFFVSNCCWVVGGETRCPRKTTGNCICCVICCFDLLNNTVCGGGCDSQLEEEVRARNAGCPRRLEAAHWDRGLSVWPWYAGDR